MSLSIVPFTESLAPQVRAMNARLAADGSDWKFYEHPVPSWLPPDDGVPDVRREYYVVTDGDAVRGAFVLKPQTFLVDGGSVGLCSWQGPVSEGLINRKFAAVGLICLRAMQERQPRLFSWGGSEKILKIVDAFGWEQHRTPLQISILNGRKFCREARVLRSSPARARMLDLFASSGLAGLGSRVFPMPSAIRARGVKTGIVSALDERADTLWNAAKGAYRCIATRDARTVNATLPQDRWPNGMLVEVMRGDRLIGWGAIRIAGKTDDRRFGDMTVGSILDALALPGEETSVCAALTREIVKRSPDVVVTHMTHATWRTALRKSGFLELAARRPFCATPDLVSLGGGDLKTLLDRTHLTPIDADGPHGL